MFTEALFKAKSSSTNRGDATLYWIFAYITIFRLDELGQDYKNLVKSQDAVKMNVFLQFLFNTETLKDHVRDEWIKEYDTSYVDDTIIGGLQRNFPTVSDILCAVEKKATGKVVQTASLSASQSESKCNFFIIIRESNYRTRNRQ